MTILSFLPLTADTANALVAQTTAEFAASGAAGRVALLFALVLLNAFFVAVEYALVKVHKGQLEDAVSDKRKGSGTALHISDHIDSYLSACQLGITASSIVLGAVAEPFLSAWMMPSLVALGIGQGFVRAIAFVISIVLIVGVHLILGEQ